MMDGHHPKREWACAGATFPLPYPADHQLRLKVPTLSATAASPSPSVADPDPPTATVPEVDEQFCLPPEPVDDWFDVDLFGYAPTDQL